MNLQFANISFEKFASRLLSKRLKVIKHYKVFIKIFIGHRVELTNSNECLACADKMRYVLKLNEWYKRGSIMNPMLLYSIGAMVAVLTGIILTIDRLRNY